MVPGHLVARPTRDANTSASARCGRTASQTRPPTSDVASADRHESKGLPPFALAALEQNDEPTRGSRDARL